MVYKLFFLTARPWAEAVHGLQVAVAGHVLPVVL